MRVQRLLPAALGLAVAVAATTPGCNCGDDTETATTSATSTSTSSGGGAGGEGGRGQGGAGDEGGGGQGGAPSGVGASATEMVSAGQVSTSPGYKMVFTLGQPTQNQGKTTSPSYRLQGGLVGANGSLP